MAGVLIQAASVHKVSEASGGFCDFAFGESAFTKSSKLITEVLVAVAKI
jgi:hypothetical protein